MSTFERIYHTEPSREWDFERESPEIELSDVDLLHRELCGIILRSVNQVVSADPIEAETKPKRKAKPKTTKKATATVKKKK